MNSIKIIIIKLLSIIFQVTDKLFACGKKFGIDLRSADIQRDRDHALGYYNDYRKYCGLKEAKSFEDYGDLIPAEVFYKRMR